MNRTRTNLAEGFARSLDAHPTKVALVVQGQAYTYEELAGHAGRVAHAVGRYQQSDSMLVGVLAQRSLTAFSAILGTLARGMGYVPLNPAFPDARNARMLHSAQPEVVVVGQECLGTLEGVLPMVEQPTTFVLFDCAETPDFCRSERHKFFNARDLNTASSDFAVSPVGDKDLAYILFTSGSTGDPKGVMVTHANVVAYVDYMVEAFDFHVSDRFSQNFDLTFDLSVHDIFLPLETGASIRCPTLTATKLPGRYIKDQEITVWFSVPSMTTVMSRLRMARPDSYPSIRTSFFCGEALPLSTTQTWQAAAPHSDLINLYGPTEATIAITRYDLARDLQENNCHNGVVSIGKPFSTQRVAVVDSDRRPVAQGEVGELCLGGSQVTLGYWKNDAKTAEQFVHLPEHGEGRWYRTGDLVFEDPSGNLQYVGRSDNQVKIMGFRVELPEIELCLRKFSGSDSVAVVAWPVQDGMAQGVEAFVIPDGSEPLSEADLIDKCGEELPTYMVPKAVHFIDELPLNPNGKLDKKQLVDRYLKG